MLSRFCVFSYTLIFITYINNQRFIFERVKELLDLNKYVKRLLAVNKYIFNNIPLNRKLQPL